MFGAAMPEAAINEHSHASAREHDIGAPPGSGDDCSMDVVPRAGREQDCAQSPFRRSVTPSD
jgi:hypothetical protein